MKRTSNKLFLCSLTSLAVLASSGAYAEEMATAPSLEGGFSGMLGGFLFTPSVNDKAYADNRSFDDVNAVLNTSTANNNADYSTGWQAAIGYAFEGTANGIELTYRSFDGSNDAGPEGPFDVNVNYDRHSPPIFGFGAGAFSDGTSSNQDNTFQNWDLMASQFLDIGTHMQMRFMAGASYLMDLDQTTKLNTDVHGYAYAYADIGAPIDIHGEIHAEGDLDIYEQIKSEYSGWGPRVAADARYDFGEMIDGFGIVGGASLGYYLGKQESTSTLTVGFDGCVSDEIPDSSNAEECGSGSVGARAQDNSDSHAVTNLRANVGIDYVYYFDNDELSTLGLELGYEVDTYFDGVATISALGGETDVTNLTFSGPYLNVKGVF